LEDSAVVAGRLLEAEEVDGESNSEDEDSLIDDSAASKGVDEDETD
jgi:hypothetical protein